MTREQAKKILPILTAYVEGKAIQYYEGTKKTWTVIGTINMYDLFIFPENYRIKPEPTYRPFRDGAECWETVHKEGFDWVKIKGDPTNLSVGIAVVNECDMFLSGAYSEKGIGYEEAFEKLTFVDGTPFGMKEE